MAVCPDDVARTLGASWALPVPTEQWALWIEDAGLLIGAWCARNGYSFAALDASVVDYVVREAVAARAKRPDSATQVDVAVDDGRVSRRYESSTGQIDIRDEWWDLLRPVDSSPSGAFTIALHFEP